MAPGREAERRFHREHLKAVPDFAGGCFRVASARHPGATYTLRALADPTTADVLVTCSCPHGRRHRGDGATCKHAAGVLRLLADNHLVAPSAEGWKAVLPLLAKAS